MRFNETILRMLLKGAVHYLYDEDNKVKILKIITDGKPYHRKLSEDRIVWRLIEQSLSGNLKICGDTVRCRDSPFSIRS